LTAQNTVAQNEEFTMTVRSPFRLAVLALLTVSAGFAPAQNNINQMIDELDDLKARFVKDEAAAKQTALKRFDAVIRKVTNGPGKAADRLAVADRLRADRNLFATKEDFPEGSDLVAIGWEYGTTLVKKYQPLSKKFDRVMNLCIQNGELNLAKKLKADKEKFDDMHLPGRSSFTGGAHYRGTRYINGAGKLYSFYVKDVQGGVFNARAEQDMQFAGHPIVDVSGSLDGIHVQCGRPKVIQGGPAGAARVEGVVLGKTMILEITTASARGQVTRSYAILRRN
jgi:hypothetical protein